jgi:integrase
VAAPKVHAIAGKDSAMRVRVTPYRNGGWEVDVRWRDAQGRRRRDRKRLTVTAKSAAQRWGEARERDLLVHGVQRPEKEVPTLDEFWTRFLDGYARANRQKPSGVAAKETIGRVHLLPRLGARRLSEITTEDIQGLKSALREKSSKTVNNVLTVLNVLLKQAVEWKEIERMPCAIRLLPIPRGSADFHDFEDYERLVAEAKALGPAAHLIVLLGGDAGLRCGEILALTWKDIDLRKRQITVQRSDWKGHVTSTKGGRLRHVPLTERLVTALQAHRHLRSERVLCQPDGSPLTQKIVRLHVQKAAQKANVPNGVHILRHTFCSHLAMQGVAALAIQGLAGHRDLATTQNYMHLSPAALDGAIRLLDAGRKAAPSRGDIGETAQEGA